MYTKSVIKHLPISINKSQRTDDFTGEFYQIFKQEITPILLKLLQTIEVEKTIPNLC